MKAISIALTAAMLSACAASPQIAAEQSAKGQQPSNVKQERPHIKVDARTPFDNSMSCEQIRAEWLDMKERLSHIPEEVSMSVGMIPFAGYAIFSANQRARSVYAPYSARLDQLNNLGRIKKC